MEVILLSGINDTEQEIEALRKVVAEISPDRIQLNTIIRPPSDLKAMPVDLARMEQIKAFLGDQAEIIAYMPSDKKSIEHDKGSESVIEMAKRRPVRLIDISVALSMTLEETGRLIKGMIIKGDIFEKEHDGEKFYVSR
jgi:wyosine [tRNA(Phe)-imidazoG37] synthetase (radical SAM superfamily)